MSRQGMRTFSTEFKEQAVLRELRITVTRPSLPLCLGASLGPGNGILRAETGGGFQAQNAGERPEFCSQTRCASLTERNYENSLGNHVGLPGLHGGGCRDRTDGHRSWHR